MKKSVRFVLAGLLASLLCTAGCGDTASSAETDTQKTDNTASVTADAETEAVRKPSVEPCDYQGQNITIKCSTNDLFNLCYYAEEETGDVLNDAIFERNRLTEEYLGVDIETIVEGAFYETINDVRQMVMAGDQDIQLALIHCIEGVGAAAADRILLDWNNVPTVDLSREYWNQSCSEALSIHGKQFYAKSDYIVENFCVTLFNKEMIRSYQLDNPYELVRSGDWTLDKLIEMASVVGQDLNGDGIYDFEDQYGFASMDDFPLCSLLYSSGIRLVDKDENGDLVLSFFNQKTADLVDRMYHFLNESEDAIIYKIAAPLDETFKITTGRVLFQLEPLGNLGIREDLSDFRSSDVDFGILPYPKYDREQKDYTNNDWSGLMCIPATITDTEAVGKVCEMLAFYSRDTVLPAYYDNLLGEKLARDPDSAEMLDLIHDHIVYDIGLNFFGFDWDSIANYLFTIPNMVVREKSNTFSSWYQEREALAEKKLRTLSEQLRD